MALHAAAQSDRVIQPRVGALAESFNATLKRETLAGAPGWDTPEQARRAVFAWITRYNTRRRHSTCGQISPNAYEDSYSTPTLQTAA